MSEHEYGHLPPKNDDGSFKQVAGRFGFWVVYSDGTFKNLATGNVHDPEDIGSGGSSSDTRVDIKDDGTSIQTDAEQIDTRGYLSASSDGAGGADVAVDLPAVVVDHPDRPPIAELADTESIEIPIRVPDGSTLEVYRWGAFDVSDGSVPTGLAVELLDGADTVQASAETANSQDKSAPVASHANGSGTVSIFKVRAYNGTGGGLNTPGVGCAFGFRVV